MMMTSLSISSLAISLLLCPNLVTSKPATSPPPSRITSRSLFTHTLDQTIHIVFQSTDAPRHLRSQGGILPQNPAPDDDDRWAYWPTFEAREWLDIPLSVESQASGQQDLWLYQIAPSPNMVPIIDEWRVGLMSLGGVLWSQVQQLAMVPSINGRMDYSRLRWELNPDFDPRWLRFGINGPQTLLSGLEPLPEGISSHRQLAQTFMNELTGSNPSLSEDQRRTLRELFNWDPETQPSRDFPLIHPSENPESLASLALQDIDWEDMDMGHMTDDADALRRLGHRARAGFATDALCFDLLSQMMGHSSVTRYRRKADQDSCEKLVKFRPELAKPRPRRPQKTQCAEEIREKAREDAQWLQSFSSKLYNTTVKSISQPDLLNNQFCHAILEGADEDDEAKRDRRLAQGKSSNNKLDSTVAMS
ncbi:hypothetical protein CP533_4070 [Ophiocordyceps camponoti-saundersi (nom. inval.)]|nr:hypothetical protein CP533_4070 [Ophiocordyceps camponoti-saundersi (nom. inval.)]